MTFSRIAAVFFVAVCISLMPLTFTPADTQFRGASKTISKPPAQVQRPPVQRPPVQIQRPPIQIQRPPVQHRRDDDRPNIGLQILSGLANELGNLTTCPRCGQTYDRRRGHNCRRQEESQPQWYTCRNCGESYRAGTRHVCRQIETIVDEGNEIVQPPPPPPVVQSANATQMKLPKLNVGNYRAMQNQIIKAALESAGTGVQVNMPSEQKISDYIDKELKVPPEDKKAILDAIKKGDTATLQTLLGNIGTTGQQLSNLMGLAKVNDALKNGGKIPPSVLIDLTKNGAPGIVSPALFSALQTYGKVQKINGLFSIAINLLNGGGSLSGQNIPTGLVPVVTMPGVPYGVVFPLGNGVWGMGIGGNVGLYAQPGLYQGYLPQPPVYSSNYVCPTNEGAAPYIFFNKTDTDIEYRFDDNSRILKLKKGYTDIGDLSSAPVEVELRKAGTSLWSSDSADTGAYKIIDSVDNTIGLEKTPTKITLKSPGNPIPFTLYANGTKFTIEPGKPLELTLPSNEVIRIQFARSSDKTDVAKHIVGGTRSFDIGIDKSTGKYALVPGKTAVLKPPKPQQSLTASSEIAYDDTKITESNLEGLPVIPDYGN